MEQRYILPGSAVRLLVAFLLALPGCGGGPSPGTPAPTTASTPTPTPVPDPAEITFVESDPPPGDEVPVGESFRMTFLVAARQDLGAHALHAVLGTSGDGPHPVFTEADCSSFHTAPFSLAAGASATMTVDFRGDPPRTCRPLPFTTTLVGAALEPCDLDPGCHDFGRAAVVRYFRIEYTLVR